MSASPIVDVTEAKCPKCGSGFVEGNTVTLVLKATSTRLAYGYKDDSDDPILGAEMDWDQELAYHADCYEELQQ